MPRAELRLANVYQKLHFDVKIAIYKKPTKILIVSNLQYSGTGKIESGSKKQLYSTREMFLN